MAESGKKWYVLRAVSGKEAKVKEYIDAELKHNTLLSTYVSQVLIPMEKHARTFIPLVKSNRVFAKPVKSVNNMLLIIEYVSFITK